MLNPLAVVIAAVLSCPLPVGGVVLANPPATPPIDEDGEVHTPPVAVEENEVGGVADERVNEGDDE